MTLCNGVQRSAWLLIARASFQPAFEIMMNALSALEGTSYYFLDGLITHSTPVNPKRLLSRQIHKKEEGGHVLQIEIGLDWFNQPAIVYFIRDGRRLGISHLLRTRTSTNMIYDAPSQSHEFAGFWGIANMEGLTRLAPIWAPQYPLT